jgi:8-oxo-dGTP diphosphatase
MIASGWSVGVLGMIVWENRLLLARHTYDDHRWRLPGGYLEGDESIETAFQRECREELSLDVVETALCGVCLKPYERNMSFVLHARAMASSLILDPQEIMEARFFPFSDLPTDMRPRHEVLIRGVMRNPRDLIEIVFHTAEKWSCSSLGEKDDNRIDARKSQIFDSDTDHGSSGRR